MAVIGGGGGGIKSIQRGSHTHGAVAAGTSTDTVAITEVDRSKSFVSASYKNGHYASYYASYIYNGQSNNVSMGAALTTDTQLTFYSGSYFMSSAHGGNVSPTIYWEVIEYE
jgi:hypothetical protein